MSATKATYYAQSVLISKTLWFNALTILLAVLQMTEVTTLIPAKYAPFTLAFNAIGNMILRQYTVRPVAFIAPSKVKAVKVDKIESTPK